MTEQRYTLSEAQHVLAVRECAQVGHRFEHVTQMGGDPIVVLCSRCGCSWSISPRNDESPAHAQGVNGAGGPAL